MRSASSKFVVVGLALVLTFAMMSTAYSAPSNPRQIKSLCVKAGVAKPQNLRAYFWLQEYIRETGPNGFLEFDLPTMPEECNGVYNRKLLYHIRYKTTLRGWRTLHDASFLTEKLTTWIPAWAENEGTPEITGPNEVTGHLFTSFEPSPKPWGKVEKVILLAKLVVTRNSTGRAAGQKLYPVHVKFAANPRRKPIPFRP